MTISDVTKQVYIQECNEMIKSRKESGLTLRAWCEQNNIPKSTYSYRVHKAKEYALSLMEGSSIAPQALLETPEKPVINLAKVERPAKKNEYDIYIKTVQYEIGINATADPEHLRQILEVIKNA